LNHALNRSSFFVTHDFWCSSRCGSAQYADNIGSSEKETNSETATEAAIVSAKGLNHWPLIPVMKPIGTKTARIENVVAATASPISAVPSRAAV
jgi:hypothetical protein